MTAADQPIAYRKAVAEDAEALPAIERSAGSAFLSVPGLEWVAQDDVLSAEQQLHWIKQQMVWVAEASNGQLIGFLTAEQFDDEYHIWELAVHQDYQKRGIGRALIAALIEQARHQARAAITLTTFRELPFNEQFYVQLGFQTLPDNQLSARLLSIFDLEKANGLPLDRRCAMQLSL